MKQVRWDQSEEHWTHSWRQASQHEGVMHGARALLALVCVLAYGWRADWEGELMPVLLGVIASALAESDDNWRGRLRAQCLALVAFVVMAAAVWLTLPTPLWLVTALAGSAFVLTMLGALGERYRAIAFGSLVLFIYAALSAHTSRADARDATPLMLAGAAWYGLVSVGWAAAVSRPPVRHRLSQLYALLGEYLHLKAQLLEPVRHADREQRRMALALHNGLVVDALSATKESLFSRLGKGRPPAWLNAALHQYLAAQDIHERTTSSHEHYDVLADALFHSDALYRCQRVLALQGDQALKISVAIARQTVPQHQGATARAIEDMSSAIRFLEATRPPDRPLRSLRALGDNLTALAAVFATVLNPAPGPLDQSLLNSYPRTVGEAWRRLRAQLNHRSLLWRHAVRLSLSLILGFAVMQLTHDPHGYWILLTIVFVSQPQYAATLKRLTQRTLGTALGLALGWALIRLFPGELVQSALLVACGAVFMGSRRTHYPLATCAITTLMLLSFHQMGMGEGVISARLLDTVTGSAIAGLAALLVLPNWQARQWPFLAAQAMRGHARYLQEILLQYQSGKVDNLSYRLARRAAHKGDAALSNALSAMLKEPPRVRLNEAACGHFLVLSHTLLNYLSALGAHRGDPEASQVDPAALAMAEGLQQQLGELARWLESPRTTVWAQPTGPEALAGEPGADAPSDAVGQSQDGRPAVQRLVWSQLQLATRLVPEMRRQASLFGLKPSLAHSDSPARRTQA
jgi:YccS/YhfK family integral membrane protein